MKVAGGGFGFDAQQVRKMARRFAVTSPGFRPVEIADVLRDESLAAARQRDRRFLMRAKSDDRRTIAAQIDRLRRETARPPQKSRGPGDHGHDAVVGGRRDGPIVRDDQIGDV